MSRLPSLVDVRQLGPEGERHLSGVCSACGLILLTRVGPAEAMDTASLRAKLERSFEKHVTEEHAREAEMTPE